MDWSRLGKKRSRFGEWIDSRGIPEKELASRSGVNRNTIGELANRPEQRPSWRTRKRLRETLEEYGAEDDFWDE